MDESINWCCWLNYVYFWFLLFTNMSSYICYMTVSSPHEHTHRSHYIFKDVARRRSKRLRSV